MSPALQQKLEALRLEELERGSLTVADEIEGLLRLDDPDSADDDIWEDDTCEYCGHDPDTCEPED